MKKGLLITSTKGMDKVDWLNYRKRGVGASDVGTILGLNPYKANIELWYERLTMDLDYSVENIAKFMGHYHEDALADLWQYWGGTLESMIANYRAGKIIRKCRRINAYVANPKYPWLFVSLDRIANKTETRGEGALELKTISGYEAKKWINNIPEYHILQLQTQILVCEFDWGEIVAMRDGRQVDVWEFKVNADIATQIVTKTFDFWQRVEQGRALLTQKYEATLNFNTRLANDLQAELESLEPEPDGTEAYESFLKDRFKRSMAHVGVKQGTATELEIAKTLRRQKETIKAMEDQARLYENVLKRSIGDGLKLDFGKDGNISWTGTPRRFLNQVKNYS